MRGLRTRVNEVYLSSVQNRFDIIALTETWLHSAINSEELFHECYNVYRKDRDNLRGGGVLLAVKKHLLVERIVQLEVEDTHCENIWLKIGDYHCKRKSLYIALFYFQPKTPPKTYRRVNDNIISLVSSGVDILILGDFNIPSFDHRKQTEIEATSDKCLLELFDLIQAANVRSFNTVVNYQGKTLDLILSNVSAVKVELSDSIVQRVDKYHPPLQLEVLSTKPVDKIEVTMKCRNEKVREVLEPTNAQPKLNYAKADFLALYRRLEKINWEPLYMIEDSDCAAQYVQKEIYDAITETVPERRVGGNQKYPIWFTKEIINMIRAKERVRRRLKKVNLPELRQKYCKLRANSKKLIKEAYKHYVCDAERQIRTNPQHFWSHINSKRKSKNDPNIMQHGDNKYTDSSSMVTAFGEYFASVYSEKKKYEGNIVGHIQKLKIDNELRNAHTVSLRHFTTSDISMAFSKLKPKRGVGPDGVPPYIYKGCKELLIPPMVYLCNLVLKTNVYPRLWVVSKVTPVPKIASTQEISNHRPISVPSMPAKIFESALYEKLYTQTRSMIPSQQHGFLRGKSIITNVMEMTHHIGQTLDRCPSTQVDIIYTDFSKAFDRVDHYKLLLKLNRLGFSEDLLKLLESYLLERRQYVMFKGVCSGLYDSPSGVPQGSNLGPYLFLLYVYDVHSQLSSNSLLYADDMKIYREIRNQNDVNALQDDVNTLVEWGEENQLALNVKKCAFIRVTRKKNPIDTTYQIKGEKLQQVNDVRDLGIQIEHNLIFKKQIYKIVNNAKRNLGLIMRHSGTFLNTTTLKILYLTLVRSHLDFAAVVWGSTAGIHIKLLERIQKRFLRFLYYKDFGYYDLGISYRELTLGYELTSLVVRREVTLILFIRDLLTSKIESPFLLCQVGLFAPIRSNRDRSLFKIAKCRTTHFKMAPINRALNTYNEIIKIDATIDIFFDRRNVFAQKITNAIDTLHSRPV